MADSRSYTMVLQNSASKHRYILQNLTNTSTNSLYYQFNSLGSKIDIITEFGEFRYWLIPMAVSNLQDKVNIDEAQFTSGTELHIVKDVCVARGILKYSDTLPESRIATMETTSKYGYYEK